MRYDRPLRISQRTMRSFTGTRHILELTPIGTDNNYDAIVNNSENHHQCTRWLPSSRECATRTRTSCLRVSSLRAGMKIKARVCTTFQSVEVSSVSNGQSEVCFQSKSRLPCALPMAMTIGSGSTYVYGYCDATYREGWGRDETIEFVRNSEFVSELRCQTIS